MDEDEYIWTINLIKDRYQHLQLSFEQAEQVHEYEEMLRQQSGGNFFSAWEEFDFTQDSFQKILNEKQFKSFIKQHKKNMQLYEERLIESDAGLLNSIEYHKALIDFYKTKHIPDFYEEKFLFAHIILSEHLAKISFIKQEYKIFLDSEKIKQISSHYRHNRLFKPNELQVSMLRHQLLEIVPNYLYFKAIADKPIQTTAEFLIEKFCAIPGRHMKFFERKEKELEVFSKKMRQKYFSDIKGWHTTIQDTYEPISDRQIMQLILLSPEQLSLVTKGN